MTSKASDDSAWLRTLVICDSEDTGVSMVSTDEHE